MVLEFTVYGNTVGKNQARGINWEQRRIFVTTAMRHWQRKVAAAAWVAAVEGGWPDPFLVSQASFKVQHYNVPGDFDRGNEYLADALQFTRWPTPRDESALPGPVGLIENDRDLYSDGSPATILDGTGSRTVVTVTLRGLRAEHDAAARRQKWYEREARRKIKQAHHSSLSPQAGVVRVVAKQRRDRDLAEIERRLGVKLPL